MFNALPLSNAQLISISSYMSYASARMRRRVLEETYGKKLPPGPLEIYVPHNPWPRQWDFLELTCLEAFFGGAAAGGKSEALLMAALQHVDVPGYAALILRRDLKRLSLAGGLIERSLRWLSGTAAKWNGSERRWTFPTGGAPATLTFGYLQDSSDRYRYGSTEFQYIAFDELTEFPENDYLFLFSRLRKTSDINAPLRMRAASNPGGAGHAWVKRRFISEAAPVEVQAGEQGGVGAGGKKAGELGSIGAGEQMPFSPAPPHPCPPALGQHHVLWKENRAYIPARIRDNPAVNEAEYRRSLLHLPPVERERLMNGDWDVRAQGLVRPHWLRYYEQSGRQLRLLLHCGRHAPRDESVSGIAASISAHAFPHAEREGHTIDERDCRRFVTIDPAGTSEDRAAEQRGRPASWTVVQVWDQALLGVHLFGNSAGEQGGVGAGEQMPFSPAPLLPRPPARSLLLLRHVRRERVGFDGLCRMLREVYARWRPVKMLIENEKLGQAAVDVLGRELPLVTISAGGKDKVARAVPLLVKLERGEVWLPVAVGQASSPAIDSSGRRGRLPHEEDDWVSAFEQELLSWTGLPHETCDQIDAAAYAVLEAEDYHGPERMEGVFGMGN